MKLLLAAPDRDLLEGYRLLLEGDGWTVVTAFDGIQAMAHAEQEIFDAAILDAHLWRVSAETITEKLNRANVPTVMLTDRAPSGIELNQPILPNTFLVYPFRPDELRACLEKIASAASMPPFDVGGVQVDPAHALLQHTIRLTIEETEILKNLSEDKPVRDGVLYVHALNAKLAHLHAQTAIRYLPGQGYRLVTHS